MHYDICTISEYWMVLPGEVCYQDMLSDNFDIQPTLLLAQNERKQNGLLCMRCGFVGWVENCQATKVTLFHENGKSV